MQVNGYLLNIMDAFPIIDELDAQSTIKGCFFNKDKTRILLKVGFDRVGLGDVPCVTMIVNRTGWEYIH
jgi:hypothetical protein